MADTLPLDTAVTHILAQGGSVRVAAFGWSVTTSSLPPSAPGGVLRDIRAKQGALQLSELVRFTDPTEGAASRALRDALPDAVAGRHLDQPARTGVTGCNYVRDDPSSATLGAYRSVRTAP